MKRVVVTQPKLSKLSLWGESNAYDEARAYRNPQSGERYPSITSILKMADKSGLAQWASDMAIGWAVNNWHLLGSRSSEDAYRSGRFRWKDVRDERAEVGTGVHEYIEAEHTNSWSFPELDAEQRLIIAEWRKFNEEHEVVPILSEFTVFDPESKSMGTADGYWSIDGIRTLIDIKTSRNHWPEHDYQLSALWHAPWWLIETSDMVWEERYAEQIESVAILHLRAPEFDEFGKVTKAGKHDLIQVKDLDLNYDVYSAYARVWYGKEALKGAEKDREKANAGF